MKQIAGLLLGLFAANLQAASVEYEVNGTTYAGYYVSPSDGAPLVLMIHDWDGITDYEIRRAGMLAAQGYAVFAADLFGQGVSATEIAERQKLTGDLYADRDKMRALMNGAQEAARAQGANTGNAVAMGYCFGGACALEWARSGAPLKGFVSFHGGLETPAGQDYSQTKGKILVLHGAADEMITLDQFAGLAKELEQAGVLNEMISYGGAPHAFTVFGTDRYREAADRNSWTRFLGFLAETLAPAPGHGPEAAR